LDSQQFDVLSNALLTLMNVVTSSEIEIDFDIKMTQNQDDGSNDCGVFLLKYAECIIFGISTDTFIEGFEERQKTAKIIYECATEENKPLFPAIF